MINNDYRWLIDDGVSFIDDDDDDGKRIDSTIRNYNAMMMLN
jgi:hypothetical protein